MHNAALFAGASLSAPQRAAWWIKPARYTGLSREYVEATNLRINIHRFCRLLRKQWRDGGAAHTFQNQDRDSAGEMFEFDPAHANLLGVPMVQRSMTTCAAIRVGERLRCITPSPGSIKLGLEGFRQPLRQRGRGHCARRCA